MKLHPLSLCAALTLATVVPGPARAGNVEPIPAPRAFVSEEASGDAEAAKEPGEADDEKTENSEEGGRRRGPVGARAQDRYSRETAEIVTPWVPVLEEVRKSTVRLLDKKGKPVAIGCVVHKDGWLITKSSEVHDRKGQWLDGLEAQFQDGLRLPVKLSDTHSLYDLALLKVPARGLRPVVWDEGSAPEPGSYLAAAAPEKLPVAIGVVSVKPRSLDASRKGFLGVSVERVDNSLRIAMVGPDTAASEAGLMVGDVILSIDGQAVNEEPDFINLIGSHRPYEMVKLKIRRGDEEKELAATLRRRPEGMGIMEDARNWMNGSLSRNRGGYPNALQHDMVLDPSECGGPVVDLEGRVVGLNIARSGRIECFAIPASALKPLLSKVETGKFHRPEVEALRAQLTNVERLLESVKKDRERLLKQLEEAEGKTVPASRD